MKIVARITAAAGFVLPFLASGSALATEGTGDVGFPQLNQTHTFASQIFWLFVSLSLLYVLMSRLALPRVASVIEGREAGRKKSLDQARAMSEDAETVRKGFESEIAKAQSDAKAAVDAAEAAVAAKISSQNAAFGDKARERLAQAEAAIAKAKREAETSLADVAADVAADMASKISGAAVTKADAKAAVAAVMK